MGDRGGAFRTLKHPFHLEPMAPTRPWACEVVWLVAFLAALLMAWVPQTLAQAGSGLEAPLQKRQGEVCPAKARDLGKTPDSLGKRRKSSPEPLPLTPSK